MFCHIRPVLHALAWVLALVPAKPTLANDAVVRWAFVTNFARYTEWPNTKWANASSPLLVCLLPGDREMTQDMGSIEKHTAGGRALKGMLVNKVSDIEQCAVLYIPADSKLPIRPLVEASDKHRVLTVSDRTDFIEEGGAIGLAPSSGRYVFDVNVGAARAAELKLSSQLLKLARTVK